MQVIGISMDDDGRDAVQQFVRRMNITYPVLQGDSHVASLYGGVEILPTTYYISRDGIVVASATGLISAGEIEQNIKLALGASSAPASQTANR
jgi:cytochrome c biogenesis protein CcmG/thiol:disulfide interchange protein DsbE